MPFALDDRYRITKFLGIAPELAETIVAARLTVLENISSAIVTQVRADLTALEELEITIGTESGDVDFALIKIDVIEFQPDRRLVGMLMRSLELIKRLGTNMGITPNTSGTTAFLSALGVYPVTGTIPGITNTSTGFISRKTLG